MKSYVSCVLETKDDEIILQLRDNNPSIKDPNCLSLFAGAMEQGETPLEAITREIREETTLSLEGFDYLFTWSDATDVESHVFYRGDIDTKQLDIREGQGYQLIKSRLDLENHEFAPISESILERYFDLKTQK